MSQYKNLSAVRNNSLFHGINDSGFTLNFNPKDFIVIEDGGIIYQPGDLSDAIYLIIDGEVKLKITGSGSPTIVKKGRNEFFGEKETLDNLSRKSSAVANKDSILYMIKKNEVISLIQKSSMIKSNLLGEVEEPNTDGTINNEIIFNEPEGKLSDLPFFNKKRTLTDKDESKIIPNEDELLNSLPDTITEKEPIAETEQDIEINNKDEIQEAEIVTSDNRNVNNANYPPNEDKISPNVESSLDENILSAGNMDLENDRNVLSNEGNENSIPENQTVFEDVKYSPAVADHGLKSENEMALFITTISKIFSGLSVEDIFITIPEAVSELLNAANGRLFLIDKETNEFRTRVKKGIEYSEIKLKFSENLFTESVNEKKTINIKNPSADELEKIALGADIQSLLIFPLKNQKGNIIGVLEFNNSIYGIFKDEDKVVLTRLSPLINLALENADFILNLLQSERMVSLNKIANFLIQDIKNPIVTIKQYAEHIKKQEISQDTLPVLDMIAEQADSVMNLVQTTLRYSEGIQISKPLTILFSTAMDNILALLAEYVESRDVKLFKKYDGDGLVNLDRKEFYQACYQIAKNACDAMPQGGNFYIIVIREGKSIRIEFKDTGLGIPASIKDRIFEPFMSHGKDDHSGLGLAITEKIVREHNGKIWAESDLGEGAAIIIVLPTSD
jgi:signal transduction histidine kinase